MVICIVGHRVLNDKYLQKRKLLAKYENDHDFGFNIGDAAQWYRYLQNHKSEFPPRTGAGEPIAYRVYQIGRPKHLPQAEKGGIYTLFPGKDIKTGEKLYLTTHGRLDKNHEYWRTRIAKSDAGLHEESGS